MCICVCACTLLLCDISGLKRGIRIRELVNTNRGGACETRHIIYAVALTAALGISEWTFDYIFSHAH